MYIAFIRLVHEARPHFDSGVLCLLVTLTYIGC